MTKNERNEEAAARQSKGLIVQNPDKFKPSTVYEADLITLENALDDLTVLAKIQNDLKHASTAPRDAARKAASMPLFEMAGIIESFAIDTKNVALSEKVRITLTELNRLPDTELVLRFSNFLSSAVKYATELIGYGLTAETVTANTALLKVYQDEIEKQGKRVIDLNGATNQVKTKLKDIENCFIPFDSKVDAKRISDSAWYNLYQSTRTVKHSPTSRLSASGKVFDAVTLQPLPGSILNITRIDDGKAPAGGSDLQKNVKIRSAGGGFKLKSLPSGTYQFTITYYGYHDLVLTVYINEGVLTNVDLPLSKIA